ncbi:MAG: hypothetical protein ACK4PR_11110, partial [Gammaproteobacteria bacterium]
YDLFVGKDKKEYIVHINERDVAENLARKTLINEILKNKEVFGKSWQLSCDKADELHRLVEASRADPMRVYNILGDVASAPNTAPDSDKATLDRINSNPTSGLIAHGIFTAPGHNCFTWSRAMLRALKLPHITSSLPIKSEELVVSVTSRILSDVSSGRAISQSTQTSSCNLL